MNEVSAIECFALFHRTIHMNPHIIWTSCRNLLRNELWKLTEGIFEQLSTFFVAGSADNSGTTNVIQEVIYEMLCHRRLKLKNDHIAVQRCYVCFRRCQVEKSCWQTGLSFQLIRADSNVHEPLYCQPTFG